MSKKNMGSGIDDFLKKENIFAEAQAQAIKEVVAWQLAKAMKKKKISKARMAVLLKTSRSQVDRILDPKRDITLSSLQRAAALVGQRVLIELMWGLCALRLVLMTLAPLLAQSSPGRIDRNDERDFLDSQPTLDAL